MSSKKYETTSAFGSNAVAFDLKLFHSYCFRSRNDNDPPDGSGPNAANGVEQLGFLWLDGPGIGGKS